MVVLCRLSALLLIAGWTAGMLFVVVFTDRTGPPLIERRGNGHQIVRVAPGTTALRVGEAVELRGTTVAQRYRLANKTLTSGWSIPVVRNGRTEAVFVASQPHNNPDKFLRAISFGFGIFQVSAGAIVLWRRPGALALFFGAFCAESIPTSPFISELTPLPDAVLGVVAPVWFALTNDIGLFALLPFVTRFPNAPNSVAGRRVMHAADFALAVAAVFFVARCTLVFQNDFTDVWFDVAPAIGAVVALLGITIARFANANGEDRRRLGWVLAGVCVSGLATTTLYTDSWSGAGPITYPIWFSLATDAATIALPIALAYAILRHRVIDLGFAVNRTVVFAVITLGLVVLVSLIDWLSGRFLFGGRFSLALEAVVTVAFGVALNWIHERVNGLVDRLFFRERHRAERLMEERMHALDFAKASSTVDDALTAEAATVMRLASAAVYRRGSDGVYAFAVAHDWPDAPSSFEADHLLVRTLRATERTVTLDASRIGDIRFPLEARRPDVAIPLAIRHDLHGFVLYGRHCGDTAIDPEELKLLEALARHAATAYDAIEADAFRREALSLRTLITALPP
ncbi:MAG: hypothetical protein NVSMB64_05350 [Candidatus Velthaea sp.]